MVFLQHEHQWHHAMSVVCRGNAMQNPSDIMLMWFASHCEPQKGITMGMHDLCACMANIPKYFWCTMNI